MKLNQKQLQTKKKECLNISKITINKKKFIFINEANERIHKIFNLFNQFKSNIPLLLECPTRISKTKSLTVLCSLVGMELIVWNISSETDIEDLMDWLIVDKHNSLSEILSKEGDFT